MVKNILVDFSSNYFSNLYSVACNKAQQQLSDVDSMEIHYFHAFMSQEQVSFSESSTSGTVNFQDSSYLMLTRFSK